MRKLIYLFLLLSTTVTYAQEQDTSWVRGGNAALYFQQVGLKNWAGGGENALSYGSNLTLFANYITEEHTWTNSFEGGYGLLKREGSEIRKNTDFFVLQSNYGRFFSENWQFSGMLDLRSQFAPGYLYKRSQVTNEEQSVLISDLFAPGYLQATIGITYRPNNKFNITFSPLANKLIFVLNDSLSNAGAYGVQPGEKMEHQIGASLLANWEREIMENVFMKTNLLLFGDYSQLRHIDIFYDLFLDMKINKWLTANVGLQMIYDHEIKIEDEDGNVGPRTQLRNVINVGVGYRFGDKLTKN
ncbi:MAG: DUF3078 domain-containing protein [Candidatus Cyclobacteriaceae bacterium M2_1C_046]